MHMASGIPKTLHDYYQSSPMREGVLCWYPFENDAVALDLSGGALTGLLRKRCASVKTSCGRDDKFDYIMALDPEDFGIGVLASFKEKLDPHGRLLLAYENPFALRYWAGKRSPGTGLQYDSLFGRGGGVSKAELAARLKQAGFEGQKWYYPLTDHWFTREVYSEGYLPDEYLNQRFTPYVADDAGLQFDERALYREIIRGGAFEFMCGAYLVEARACGSDEPCPVDYAAVTAYREPAKRFATVVSSNGRAYKIPLHEEARERMQIILRNHGDLARSGVNVVPLRLENDALVMERMEFPTLWDYWADKLTNGSFDENEMFRHLDKIRDAILKSAVSGKCYWELVPANCFYDAAKDEPVFFDQEYCWENAPPDIALARAILSIRYSPALRSDPRSEGWLRDLKARYNLNERWEMLERLVNDDTYREVFGDRQNALTDETARAMERAAAAHRGRRLSPIAEKLRSLGHTHPAIYGFGKRGKALRKALFENGFEIAAVYDRELTPDASIEEFLSDGAADSIIVSVLQGMEIAEDLRKRTGIPVYTAEELLNGQP